MASPSDFYVRVLRVPINFEDNKDFADICRLLPLKWSRDGMPVKRVRSIMAECMRWCIRNAAQSLRDEQAKVDAGLDPHGSETPNPESDPEDAPPPASWLSRTRIEPRD